MNILAADHLSKSYSDKPLFQDLSISLTKGEKVALIGANGCGKSTLLRILANRESADTGTSVIRKGTQLGYLEQDPVLDPELTVIDAILDKDHPVKGLLNEYELLIAKNDKDPKRMQELLNKIDNANAWSFEARIREVLSRLGLHDFDKKVKELSGGQKKRTALAQLLLDDLDLIILDEPTNHLDLDMIEWLEEYLVKLNRTVLLVSHDRYFVDQVCNAILELEDGKLFKYQGNYGYYLEKREERIEAEQSEIKKYRNLYRKELDWMRKQPRARGTKQKARVKAFDEIEDKAFSGKTESSKSITMQMDRLGSKIIEFENLCKSFDKRVLIKDFSHVFKKGEKVGIVGKNGAGKTTLLKMVTGEIKPDDGRIKKGETLNIGYFSQDGLKLNDEKLVIDVIRDITEYVDTGKGSYMNAKQFLSHFLFDGNKQFRKVGTLSGGEKKRLYLLSILVTNPNFLILDEPTNDLDIVTLNILEAFLDEYQGCLMMVTHDRYFMDRIVDHIFVFEDNGVIKDIHGNYTDYRNEAKDKAREQSNNGSQKDGPDDTKVSKPRKGLSFKEKYELEQIESELNVSESKAKELLALMDKGTDDHQQVHKWSEAYGELQRKIDQLTERWLILEEKKNQADQ